VVLLLESSDLERLIRDRERVNQFRRLVQRKSWILGSVGMDQELAKEWSNRFHANLLIMQPHVSPNPDFQSYFLSNVKVSQTHHPLILNCNSHFHQQERGFQKRKVFLTSLADILDGLEWGNGERFFRGLETETHRKWCHDY